MPVRIVQSKQNGRLKELRRALSRPGHDDASAVGIEGPNLIEEAIRAGIHIHTLFAAADRAAWVNALSLPSTTEVLLLPAGLLASALATETPQPIAALVEPPRWTWDRLLAPRAGAAPLLLVLAGLQDPGNLGSLLRSAEAFGASGVVALPGTVTPWNPKAVRASAGSVFRMPFLAATAEAAFDHLRDHGVRVFAAAPRAAIPADTATLASASALLIGNEGNGLPPDLLAQADASIAIPCPGPVESLNATVAASILLYEAARQRARLASTAASHPRGAQ